jgi:hypothetical protein
MFKITLAALAMAGTARASLIAVRQGATAPLCEIIWQSSAGERRVGTSPAKFNFHSAMRSPSFTHRAPIFI